MCTHADNKLADDDSAVIVKEVNIQQRGFCFVGYVTLMLGGFRIIVTKY